MIPVDKKPDIICDETTELKFCGKFCYQEAQKHYLQVLKSKWTEFKAIENWILINKGPPHDQGTDLKIIVHFRALVKSARNQCFLLLSVMGSVSKTLRPIFPISYGKYGRNDEKNGRTTTYR